MSESLELKLKRLQQEMAEAEWLEQVERVIALDYEIRMTKYRISIGQTHDAEF